ncbi:hypothetical protein QQP08_020827 [Theobroma cacao]|nr:hypothetical protein QQP08_020827 [Theobroma cacao]
MAEDSRNLPRKNGPLWFASCSTIVSKVGPSFLIAWRIAFRDPLLSFTYLCKCIILLTNIASPSLKLRFSLVKSDGVSGSGIMWNSNDMPSELASSTRDFMLASSSMIRRVGRPSGLDARVNDVQGILPLCCLTYGFIRSHETKSNVRSCLVKELKSLHFLLPSYQGQIHGTVSDCAISIDILKK